MVPDFNGRAKPINRDDGQENPYPLVNVHITMENHHFQWVNPLFLSPFSIAM